MPPPARVWLVEDEPPYRDALEAVLGRAEGVVIERAFGTAEAALEAADGAAAAEAGGPDLVVLDVNLPGMGGVEAAGQLRARLPSTRVVMLTVRDDADTLYAALRAGASGYLLKDAPADVLVQTLRQALDGALLVSAPVARRVLDFFRAPQPPDYGLSPREREVLQRMAEGLVQKEIAAALHISPATVNGHVQRVYDKLAVRSSTAAVAKALRERLI